MKAEVHQYVQYFIQNSSDKVFLCVKCSQSFGSKETWRCNECGFGVICSTCLFKNRIVHEKHELKLVQEVIEYLAVLRNLQSRIELVANSLQCWISTRQQDLKKVDTVANVLKNALKPLIDSRYSAEINQELK